MQICMFADQFCSLAQSNSWIYLTHLLWHCMQLMSDLLTSQKIQLKLQTSLANPHVPRRMSSGAIQIKLPIWVAVFVVGPFTSLPKPKSAILTLLSAVMSKFGVFKSRCATPCSCNQERPAVTPSIASLPLQPTSSYQCWRIMMHCSHTPRTYKSRYRRIMTP